MLSNFHRALRYLLVKSGLWKIIGSEFWNFVFEIFWKNCIFVWQKFEGFHVHILDQIPPLPWKEPYSSWSFLTTVHVPIQSNRKVMLIWNSRAHAVVIYSTFLYMMVLVNQKFEGSCQTLTPNALNDQIPTRRSRLRMRTSTDRHGTESHLHLLIITWKKRDIICIFKLHSKTLIIWT